MSNVSVSNTINTSSLLKTTLVSTTSSIITNQTINVAKGDTFDNNIISTGGIINVDTSASVTENSFYDGAVLNVSANATTISNDFYNGAVLNVSASGMAVTNNFYEGASYNIATDGVSVMDVIHNGATMTVNGGIVSELSVSGGNVTLGSDSYMDNGQVFLSGNIIASSGAIIDSLTINSGGSATILSGAYISSLDTTTTDSTITVATGGTLTLDPSAGGIVNMATGSGTNLIISATSTVTSGVTTTINGLSGSLDSAKLTLVGVKEGDVASITSDASSVTFALVNGNNVTLNITGADQINFTDSSIDTNGNLVYEVCFLTGTIINAGLNNYAVEDIQIGDEIMTYDWKNGKKSLRPIIWVGQKHVVVNPNLSDDQAGYPIRVIKNAISNNVPNKDLLITPEHCLFFNNKFVPVRMLVNNHSIYYDRSITSYDYYHIETENHSVIFADGVMTESYLNTGNRQIFTQSSKKVINLSTGIEKKWEYDSAAPLIVSRDIIEPIYNQINKRAHDMNISCKNEHFQLTDNADIHVITNTGEIIRDYIIKNNEIIFQIPSNTQFIKIMSRVSRPNETIGSFIDDRRSLGILIGEIKISQANKNEIITTHYDAAYFNGWNDKENHFCRWTKGNAMLMIKPLVDTQEPIMVSLQKLAGGPYFVDKTLILRNVA